MSLESPTDTVLLGAGASADAGLPTTVDMTDRVLDRVDNPLRRRLLEFVHHMLEADAAVRNAHVTDNPFDPNVPVTVDVERLFAAVELLVDRPNQPWSPFVAAWHAGLDPLLLPRALAEGLSSALLTGSGANSKASVALWTLVDAPHSLARHWPFLKLPNS